METTTLTREAVMAMEAGPEMDALVAERVMGWDHADIIIRDRRDEPFQPSSNIAAAWEVVDRLGTPGGIPGQRLHYVKVEHDTIHTTPHVDGFTCTIEPWDELGAVVRAFARTAPLAIARAALLSTL